MSYYPKNKILTNQVATQDMVDKNGQTYNYVLLSNNQYYQGYFYALYNGKTYTGKYPGDGVNNEIIKLINDIDAYDGPIIIPSLITTNIPPLFPTPQDYKNGFFIRYFYKKRNEYLFKELTQDEYNNLNQPNNRDFYYYKPFSIKWMLTGDKQKVTDFNFYSIAEIEKQENVYGLNEFLNLNYTQYYKPTA